jgi:hypothetical protein
MPARLCITIYAACTPLGSGLIPRPKGESLTTTQGMSVSMTREREPKSVLESQYIPPSSSPPPMSPMRWLTDMWKLTPSDQTVKAARELTDKRTPRAHPWKKRESVPAASKLARPFVRSAIFFKPSGPWYTAYIAAMLASKAWAVQMLEVALSRRMCCSRVCMAIRRAGLPCASLLRPAHSQNSSFSIWQVPHKMRTQWQNSSFSVWQVPHKMHTPAE